MNRKHAASVAAIAAGIAVAPVLAGLGHGNGVPLDPPPSPTMSAAPTTAVPHSGGGGPHSGGGSMAPTTTTP